MRGFAEGEVLVGSAMDLHVGRDKATGCMAKTHGNEPYRGRAHSEELMAGLNGAMKDPSVGDQKDDFWASLVFTPWAKLCGLSVG